MPHIERPSDIAPLWKACAGIREAPRPKTEYVYSTWRRPLQLFHGRGGPIRDDDACHLGSSFRTWQAHGQLNMAGASCNRRRAQQLLCTESGSTPSRERTRRSVAEICVIFDLPCLAPSYRSSRPRSQHCRGVSLPRGTEIVSCPMTLFRALPCRAIACAPFRPGCWSSDDRFPGRVAHMP